MTIIEIFAKGKWAMWPLLAFSILTISIIIERIIYIFYHNLETKTVAKNILNFIRNNDIKGAKEYCQKCDKKLISAQIVLSGLDTAELGQHNMEKVMETKSSEKINQLERGFNLLVALGSLAPITGFLGTVSGMISAFQSIASAAEVNAQLVASGIFEALITTAYGLLIAIIAIAGYNFFSFFIDKFVAEIENLGSEIITTLLKINNKTQVTLNENN